MTQSKDNDTFTIDIDDLKLDDIADTTINLNDTYGTTTTFWNGGNITDINISSDYDSNDGTYTITGDTSDTINIGDWAYYDNKIDPDKIERMIKHYPGLEKVWRNFKQVYEMCKQDYEGKIKAGEINDLDDNIPF